VLTEVHPIDHQRHQLKPSQLRGQQLGQRGLGLSDEPARHRRTRRAGGAVLDARPDRLQPDQLTPGREPGEHPIQGHPPEDLGPGNSS
jgi:hypothetical protein